MSEQSKLTNDLAELESRLGQLKPKSGETNRDELMYQAGWAAAEVRFGQLRNKTSWGWPSISGGLAAAVLLLGFLLSQGEGKLESSQYVDLEDPTPEAVLSISTDTKNDPMPVRRNRWTVRLAPMLAMREAALHTEVDFPQSNSYVGDFSEQRAVSARELMQEYLPDTQNVDAAQQSDSFWNLFLGGTS